MRARSTSASLCSSSAVSLAASGRISCGKVTLKACGRADADGAERAAQAAQRLEAEANLHQHCADNAEERSRTCPAPGHRRSSSCRRAVDLAPAARDRRAARTAASGRSDRANQRRAADPRGRRRLAPPSVLQATENRSWSPTTRTSGAGPCRRSAICQVLSPIAATPSSARRVAGAAPAHRSRPAAASHRSTSSSTLRWASKLTLDHVADTECR